MTKHHGVRRLTATVLALLMALSLLPISAIASDIAGHWAEAAVTKSAELGIMNGYQGDYKPDDTITRAEFAAMVNRAFGYTYLGYTGLSGVNDVSASDWYAQDGTVAAAIALGTLTAYNGKFNPNGIVTREMAFTVLGRVLRLTDGGSDLSSYSDASSIASWAKHTVAAMDAKGYVNGVGDGKFAPQNPIDRASVATLILRIAGEIVDTDIDAHGTAFKNVTIRKAAMLSNATVTNDLYISEGVGVGDVVLENVVVEGDVYVLGGGENSVRFINCSVKGKTVVNPPSELLGHGTHVSFEGTTAGTLVIADGAEVQLSVDKATGIMGIVLNDGGTLQVTSLTTLMDINIQAADGAQIQVVDESGKITETYVVVASSDGTMALEVVNSDGSTTPTPDTGLNITSIPGETAGRAPSTGDNTGSVSTTPGGGNTGGNSSGGGNSGGGNSKPPVTRYTVTFNINYIGGTAPASQSIVNGGKVTQPTAPTRAGYTFDGWYKEAACKNAWNFSTDTVTATTTLYAKWIYMGSDAVSSATVTPLRVVPGNSTVVALVGYELGENTTIKVFSDAEKTQEVSSEYLTISIGSGGLSLDGEYVRTFILHTKAGLPLGNTYEVVVYNNGVKQDIGTGFIVQDSYAAPADAIVYKSNGVGYTSEIIPVAYGTSEFDALSQLRAEASVLRMGASDSLHGIISWEFENTYNPTIPGEYTVTGTIGLPSMNESESDPGWKATVNNTETQTLTVTAKIVLLPQSAVRSAIVWTSNSISSLADFNTTEQASWGQVRFQPTVTISGELRAYNSAGTQVATHAVTALASLSFVKPAGIEDETRTTQGGPPNFTEEYCLKAGEYTAYGTVTLPAGWTGTPEKIACKVVVAKTEPAQPAATYTVSGTVTWDAVSSATVKGSLTVNLYAASDTKFATSLGTGTIGSGNGNWSSSPVNYSITTAVADGSYVVRIAPRSGKYLQATAAVTVTNANVTNANLTLQLDKTGTPDAVSHATVNPYFVVKGTSTVVFLSGASVSEESTIKVLDSSKNEVASGLKIMAGAAFDDDGYYGCTRGFTLKTDMSLIDGIYTVEVYHANVKQTQSATFEVVASYTAPAGARAYSSSTYSSTVISVPFGTTAYDALAELGGFAALLDKTPGSQSLHYGIAWTLPDNYDGNTVGQYIATGTIGLPSADDLSAPTILGWSNAPGGVTNMAPTVTAEIYVVPAGVDDSKTTTVWKYNAETLDPYVFTSGGREQGWGNLIRRPAATIVGTQTLYNSLGQQLAQFDVTAIAQIKWNTMPDGFEAKDSNNVTMMVAGNYTAYADVTLPTGWTGTPDKMALEIYVPKTTVTLSKPTYIGSTGADDINELLEALWEKEILSFDVGNETLSINKDNGDSDLLTKIEELFGNTKVPILISFSGTAGVIPNGSGVAAVSAANYGSGNYIVWVDLDSSGNSEMKVAITASGGAVFKIEASGSYGGVLGPLSAPSPLRLEPKQEQEPDDSQTPFDNTESGTNDANTQPELNDADGEED